MSDDSVVDFMQNILDVTSAAINEPPRQCRNNSQIIDAFELRETTFIKHFRLNKNLARMLINIIEPIESLIERKTNINLETKVLCALHFFGTGSYQTPVGNLNILNVSQPTTSRCISEVVEALNHPSIFNKYIKFPATIDELNEIAQGFYSAYNFPGCIGCIDCTHVAIVTPGPPFHENVYVNRKNYHSINTQLICDSNLKIMNVNALFPGSTHDAYIWNNSRVLPFMENLHRTGYSNYHLIGDSGYPLRPWCLTPILHAEQDTPEFRYNETLTKTRATIERCNGVLKGRFRCLLRDRVLHYQPNKATKIINACCILHNFCINNNYSGAVEPIEGDLFGTINVNSQESSNAALIQGRIKQRQIMNNYFH